MDDHDRGGLATGDWERRLGDAIRSTRRSRDLTQAELARRANIDRTTVNRIERGEGGSIHSLVQIARALGREEWLDGFAPPTPSVSPMELLRAQQRMAAPRRVRAASTAAGP